MLQKIWGHTLYLQADNINLKTSIMKKLFKKLKSINRLITDCEKSIANMEKWTNKTQGDIFDLNYEKDRLPRLVNKKASILMQISEAAIQEATQLHITTNAKAA